MFYQAALLVAPQNYMAANDLGVLLARAGNLRDARAMLEHSAANGRQSTVLHNLATVYQKLGRNDLAAQANQQAMLAQQAEQAPAASGRRSGRQRFGAMGRSRHVRPNLAESGLATVARRRNPAVRPQTGGIVRQTPPARPATNASGGNNPHWSPNNPAI